jgi:hypothetical protein
VKRWQVELVPIYVSWTNGNPKTRHWTRRGAVNRANLWRRMGLTEQFAFILHDRRTGKDVFV